MLRLALIWSITTLAVVAQGPSDPADHLVRIVRFRADATPGRASCLESIRTAIVGRASSDEVTARIADLDATTAVAHLALSDLVENLGGTVRRRLRLIAGAVVTLPAAKVEQLTSDAWIRDVLEDAARPAHIRRSTDLANHRADLVQELGIYGAGANLALIDSGLDLISGTTGTPHPSLAAPPGAPSRILRSIGLAVPGDEEDMLGHGTAVGGIAIGRSWNPGLPESDDGFAPAAGVASYKITRTGESFYLDSVLLAALDEVALDRVTLDLGVANFSWAGVPDPCHPTQEAIDTLGHDFDVLVVTSAGNDADWSSPTLRSCSNANGLCVAALQPDTHQVWSKSSFGPLEYDPERDWPDLAAVGVGLRTPWPNAPTGVSPALNGTSFAAPAVAGTAVLLRADAPSISALDTKALILNSVADLTGANPARSRAFLGLGMLRTDLALDQLRRGGLARGDASGGAAFVDRAVPTTLGLDYAATLVWSRVDATMFRWDDLDLEVLDPNGTVVARSVSRRNLYERVMFRAAVAGTYVVRIRFVDVLHPSVPWSLAFGENLGGCRQPGDWTTMGAGCPTHGTAATVGIVVPTFLDQIAGNTRTPLPLAGGPCRVLQILDGTCIPYGTVIEAIGLRRDPASVQVPSFRVDLEILLAHTQDTPAAPAPNFGDHAELPGEPATVVARRTIDLAGVVGAPGLDRFEYVIPLDTPFVARTSVDRNLAVQFKVYGHDFGSEPFGLLFDAAFDPRGTIVYALGDPNAPSGGIDPLSLAIALFTDGRAAVQSTIGGDTRPQVGSPFRAVLRDAPPGASVALLHGGGSTWAGLSLPIDLTTLGAPGCVLLVGPDVILPATVGPHGQAFVQFSVPADPRLTGATFQQQFLLLDPAANAFGLAVTAGISGWIGG